MNILEITSSVCPACYKEGTIKKIDAKIIQDNNTIWITKQCNKHGTFKTILTNDPTLYNKWIQYKTTGDHNPNINTKLPDGTQLYPHHTSKSILTNLLITNRCNQRCNYCTINAGTHNHIYEPTLDQIKKLLIQARSNNPHEAQALHITGGEPTLRLDLFIILRMANEIGYTHLQLHTNGITLAQHPTYSKQLQNEHLNTIYLSFDGTTPDTNPLLTQCYQAIENLKNTTLKVVLVPVITHKNLKETGNIIRYALKHMDIIRGIQFQPLTYCGRATNTPHKQRITPTDIFTTLEQEFKEHLTRQDFYPAAFAQPISNFIESQKWHTHFELTPHPLCSSITYLFNKNNNPLPITRFIDVEKIVPFIQQQTTIKGPLRKIRKGASFIKNASKFIHKEHLPTGLNIKQLLSDITVWDSNEPPATHQIKSLLVSILWYQDPDTLDIDRLKRCIIHYTTPEGIIPYCTYHALNIGEKIFEKHGIPQIEWEQKTGKTQKQDI